MDLQHLLAELNPEQRRAVTSNHPRLLCIAGAGAGKTKSLALRIVRLRHEGVAAERILALTFTRAAAAEMRERVEGLLEDLGIEGRLPEIRTLHSWGAQLLRMYAEHFGRNSEFTIYDDLDHEDIVRACARDLGIKTFARSKLPTLWREKRVQDEYARRLLEGNALDYDMIETFTLRLLQEHPGAQERWIASFQHVLVDEYQDTNLAQVAIVAATQPPNLFIVGDPRQSIYLFRGAEPATIVAAARDADYEVIELVSNYRSVPEVIDLANGCVAGDWLPMVAHRPPTGSTSITTHLVRHQGPAVAELLHHLHHIDGHNWGDIYVLGRTWAAVDQVRTELVEQHVPHRYGGKETDPWATNDGRNLARMVLLMRNPGDANLVALLAEWGVMGASRFPHFQQHRGAALLARTSLLQHLATLDIPERGGPPAWKVVHELIRLSARPEAPHFVDVLTEVVQALGVFDTYEARDLVTRLATLHGLLAELRAQGFDSAADFSEWWTGRTQQEMVRKAAASDEVALMTVHGSKGLEAPVIVMLDCYDGQYPSGRAKQTAEERAENLRIFYVGVTRARDRLLLTVPQTVEPPWGGPAESVHPSPYLAQAGAPSPAPWRPTIWGGALPVGW